jgi:hypothetical protein
MEYSTSTSPPTKLHGKVDWASIAEFARKRPGKWVEVPVKLSPGVPYQINKNTYPHLPMSEFEVTSRASEPSPEGKRRVTVYVRFK